MNKNITRIAVGLQELLGETADRLARETGFIQRQVTVTGSGFVQALVFGFLGNPDLSYGEMSQSAAAVGVAITPQGIEQRFSETAVAFMERMLNEVVQAMVVEGTNQREGLLGRFNGVYLRDSSVVMLPDSLVEKWRGNGSAQGKNAALKLHVEMNYSSGQLRGPELSDGRSADLSSSLRTVQLPAGALDLADLGYFELDRFAEAQKAGVYWLSRWKVCANAYWPDGQPIEMLRWLRDQEAALLDVPIQVGANHRIPCRLLVERVPPSVAQQRRRRIREAARQRGESPSQESLALADWTIVITNAPLERISAQEAFILLHIRWQIELLFKLWKSHAKIDEWRSANPHRILCELYAKLIGVVVSQWMFITAFWYIPDRSLFRAAKTIRMFAIALAATFDNLAYFMKVLTILCTTLQSSCTVQSRKTHPAAFQLLLHSPLIQDPLC
jgi:hypothetical protein